MPPVDTEATPLAQAARKAGGRKKAIPTRPSKRTKFDDKGGDGGDDPGADDEAADDTEATKVT